MQKVFFGDMPIYVAHDSMDVWQNPSQFLLDEKYNPTVVAGVPPDAFSADGQLWGNPIYSWKTMQNERYGWWKNRVGQCFKLYDILRIDHFRGFAGYYVIPAGDTTAKNGGFCGVNVYNCENRQKLLTIAISCDIIIKH